MIVVSDTSCISNLLTIGHAHLLQQLFGTVIVPPAVDRELRRFHLEIPDFIRTATPVATHLVERLTREVDLGEAEAICLARELKADRLLIDEKRGRTVAEREGLAIIGVLGILILAKENKLLTSVSLLIDRLEKEAGFRLTLPVKQAALRKAGETVP